MTALSAYGARDEIVEKSLSFFATSQAREDKNASVSEDEDISSPGLWEPVASPVDGSASDPR